MFNAYSFFIYVFITAYTPGPNNIMSMSNASKYGFRESLPFNIGIFAGQLAVIALCTVFSVSLYAVLPTAKPFMLAAGAAYMLYLAWKMLKSAGELGEDTRRGNSFMAGMTLQFVNAKYIIYCITAMSTYIIPNFDGVYVLAAFALFLALMGFSATIVWAASGSVFRRLFEKHARALNAVMAFLLVCCAVSLFV